MREMSSSLAPSLLTQRELGARAEFEIRPGVIFPDWGAIKANGAEAALLTIFQAVGIERRWNHYRHDLDRIRTAILEGFVETSRAPSLSSLSATTGVKSDRLLLKLNDLKERDLIVLSESGEAVTGAYPFTESSTEHRVHLDSQVLNAMCAIDALGVGAMVGKDVTIESSCRACAAPVHVETAHRGTALDAYIPESAVVWIGDQYAGGCGATSLCTTIAFFCSDEHLLSWRDSAGSGIAGHRLSVDEAHQIGRAVFGPMLKTASINNHEMQKSDDE